MLKLSNHSMKRHEETMKKKISEINKIQRVQQQTLKKISLAFAVAENADNRFPKAGKGEK